ncbi:MAG: serine/threonine protein kinase [Cyanobacteria bacterium]|nr:serine/threonine protein kinase [Cyanobacteriota bacterium]MDW8199968.1 serine/threonine-protein kinase [Cyanobacteriota bacterium SKYGB_h_bin112]
MGFFELESTTGSTGLALVQTFIQGRSLAALLQQGRRFSEAETIQIGAAVLDILTYLHGLNPPVIHRDIKPDNILLGDGSKTLNHVYLVDFGAVKTIGIREATTFTIVGTHGYMPPEQFSGRVSVASDLYSLGTTLVTVATGVPINKIPHRNLRLRFEELAPLSPEFTAWLKWMTEPEVSNRPASAQAALESLLNPKTSPPVAQQPTSTLKNLRKPPGSRVVLVKTGSFLEVRLPCVGITRLTIWLIVAVLAIDGTIAFWLYKALTTVPNGELIPLVLPLSATLVAMGLTGLVVFILWGRTRLRLDDRISLSYELMGLRWVHPQPDNIRKVTRLAAIQTVPLPHIILQAGTTRYCLGRNLLLTTALRLKLSVLALGALTGAEVAWLSHELSNWLKLSVANR